MLRTGDLLVPDAAGHPLVFAGEAPPATPAMAAVRADGSCAFYERGTGLCAIHRQVGARLLPVTCRQFPRVSLADARGVFVNLSHYCPTAARLLVRDDVPLRIVEAPPAFPLDFEYDPLDARDALPPLLTPAVLLDLETFGRWERQVIAAFADEHRTPEQALAAVTMLTWALCRWKPGTIDLASHLDRAVEEAGLKSCSTGTKSAADQAANPADPGHVAQDFSPVLVRRHYALVLAAIPDSFRPIVSFDSLAQAHREWVQARWPAFAAPVRRYLAAKAFASWLAYQGRGLRTIVFSLDVALSVLKANAALECEKAGRVLDEEALVAAIRRTDELLLHLASREDLARRLGAVETGRSGRRVEKVAGALSSGVP
jgi:hypothetical protein